MIFWILNDYYTLIGCIFWSLSRRCEWPGQLCCQIVEPVKKTRLVVCNIETTKTKKEVTDNKHDLTLYSKGWGFLIRIRSVNRTKGVKVRFEYDHIAPSGFGVAPIKRVPTAMFSLVRIWPIFEQEAPKWPWDVFNDLHSNTIQVGLKRG